MKRACVALVVTLVLAGLAFAPRASAHGERIAYLEVVLGAPGEAYVAWRTPSAKARPVFPEGCTLQLSGGEAARSQLVVTYWASCKGPLAGETLRLDGLGDDVSAVVVRVVMDDGHTHSQLVTAADPTLVFPEGAPRMIRVVRRYVRLGVTHILGGLDHLLFVLGLLFLADTRRRLVATITAFTLAHSLSLAATALSWIAVPSRVAEASIAASLILLGLDIGRARKAPLVLSFVFGLVHGLGFAGALAETSLPEGAVAPALFAFNAGVELGQLGFVAACLALAAVAKRLIRDWPRKASETAAAYAIGGIGSYLALSRILGL